MKLTDIRGMWKKNKYWEENLQTDTVTVNFAPVKSVQKDSAMEVDELTAFFFLLVLAFWNSCQWTENLLELPRNLLQLVFLRPW